MDDNNTSNTPDNASRPGKAPHPNTKKSRPRRSDGKFMTNAEIAERDRQRGIAQRTVTNEGGLVHVVESGLIEELNNAVNELSDDLFDNLVEEAKAWPPAGAKGDITVEEFLALRDKVMGDSRHRGTMTGRIGQHVDVENKSTKSHTRRAKTNNNRGPAKSPDNRRTMLYHIRTLPNKRGYGLFYADGVELDEVDTKSKNVIVKHWLGENWYQAIDAGAAKVFESADDARKFRREHFNVAVDDTSVKNKGEARRALNRQFRVMGASVRHPSHTTKNKTERKPRKVREDLTKLYSLIGRTS